MMISDDWLFLMVHDVWGFIFKLVLSYVGSRLSQMLSIEERRLLLIFRVYHLTKN